MQVKTITICEVDRQQFQLLLQDLENRNDISIRLQVKGEPWMEEFFTLLVFSRKEAILIHLQTRTVKYVPDLNEVIGFEIDRSHTIFEAYERYDINPLSELLTDYELRHGKYSV